MIKIAFKFDSMTSSCVIICCGSEKRSPWKETTQKWLNGRKRVAL